MLDRAQIKQRAKREMKQQYGSCVGTGILASILQWTASLTGLGAFLLAPHFDTGYAAFSLSVYRGRQAGAGMLFDEGFRNYGRKAGAYFLRALYIFLWESLFYAAGLLLGLIAFSILVGSSEDVLVAFVTQIAANGAAYAAAGLLAIPGVVIAYSYSLVPCLLADRPELKAGEALKESRRLMQGYKWPRFVLDLSFIGWDILTGMTCGILGIFYTVPYYETAKAGFYAERTAGQSPSRPLQSAPAGAPLYGAAPASPSVPGGGAQMGGCPGGQACLSCTAGEFQGARFPLKPGAPITIGRSTEGCQIVLRVNAAKISRRHCRILFDPQAGRYIVSDFSTNGTFLGDGRRLPGGGSAVSLPRGTDILLDQSGSVAFKLE